MRRLLLLAALLTVWCAAPAAAHDSLAPPGAGHNWLPDEDWVYRHWIPFDEWRLKAALGLHGRELEGYLINDHRTLAELARRRGLDPDALADQLVQPMAAKVSADQLATLRERTMRILTQGHLAQHMFFHVYHGTDLKTDAQAIFGLLPETYYAQRKAGKTPHEAALMGGHSDADVSAAMEQSFQADFNEGIRLGVADPDEQQIMLQRRQAQVACWITRPLPVFDDGHPYGHHFKGHGRHARGWPRTWEQKAEDEARVEWSLEQLKSTCWKPPHAWKDPSTAFRAAVRRHLRHLRAHPLPKADMASANPADFECTIPTV